jgi:beta-aspartyl-dipeptidase (metallo-type)
MNRNSHLFEEGIAYAREGGFLDFTTSTARQFLEEGEVKCSRALATCLDRGVSVENLTFSSDGQGSLPVFDADNEYIGLKVGTCASLFTEVRDAVREEGVPLETALKVITENPARIYKLPRKGRLREGFDADLVLLDPQKLEILSVMALGRMLVEDGVPVVKGTFES